MKKKPSTSHSLTDYAREHGHAPSSRFLLTENEMGAEIGEPGRRIRSWAHAGIIPRVVLGHRTIRYIKNDVIEALKSRTVDAL
jgi:hypothetical protein